MTRKQFDNVFVKATERRLNGKNYETSGGIIRAQDMLKLKETENVICLGEVMNYKEIIEENDSEVQKFISLVHDRQPSYPLEGHCPALKDFDLAKYLYRGIRSDHCTHDMEELKQRFENGMFVQLQDSMISKEVIDYLTQHQLYDYFSFVSDDTLPDVLMEKGHLDAIVRKAIALGMKPGYAIYCATYTPARRMNLPDRGAIAPGLLADFLFVDDPKNLQIRKTFKKGVCIFDIENGSNDSFTYDLDGKFEDTIHSRKMRAEDFRISVPGKNRFVNVRVMKTNPLNNRSEEAFVKMEVANNELLWKESGTSLTCVIERHGRDNHIAYGFTLGSAIEKGACASSYAHDSHNLIVMGKDEEDMALTINRVIDLQGGIVTALNGRITSQIALPIAGLLSRKAVQETAKEFKAVRKAFDEQGYKHINSIMNFSLIALTCIPVLKLTDRGYLNTETFSQPPLYEESADQPR